MLAEVVHGPNDDDELSKKSPQEESKTKKRKHAGEPPTFLTRNNAYVRKTVLYFFVSLNTKKAKLKQQSFHVIRRELRMANVDANCHPGNHGYLEVDFRANHLMHVDPVHPKISADLSEN